MVINRNRTCRQHGVIRNEISVNDYEFYQKVFIANYNYYLSGVFSNGGIGSPTSMFDSLVNSNGTTTASSASITTGEFDVMVVPINMEYSGQPVYVKITVNSSTIDPNILIVVTIYSSSDVVNQNVINEPIVNGDYYLNVSGYPFLATRLEIALDNSTVSTIANWSAIVANQAITYTEEKTLLVNQDCYSEYIYLEWKNKRGGFDKWLFTGFKDVNVNILSTQEKDRNIYLDWENSYDEFVDTITEETSRTSRQEFVVRSQNVTEDQINYIVGIKSSALVNQVTSKYDRRRVIVDRSSFTIKQEGDKLYNITFTIRYTNNIASQSL